MGIKDAKYQTQLKRLIFHKIVGVRHTYKPYKSLNGYAPLQVAT